METCIICGKETIGSVGKAGIGWSFICQLCKNSEDNLLETRLKYEAEVMDKIEKFLTEKGEKIENLFKKFRD